MILYEEQDSNESYNDSYKYREAHNGERYGGNNVNAVQIEARGWERNDIFDFGSSSYYFSSLKKFQKYWFFEHRCNENVFLFLPD